jgi:hypothetical protein
MDKKTDNQKNASEEFLRGFLREGDTLTHTRCCGTFEEHVFTGFSGRWICGVPTKDTKRLGGSEFAANDIFPSNVTHINRTPVDICIHDVQFKDRIAKLEPVKCN